MLDAQLEATRRFRRTDPGTSMAAAEMAAPLVHAHWPVILAALELEGRPMGATEIAGKTKLTQVQICRRLPELQRAGLIRVDGEGKTPAGRPQRLWVLA